eukprot:2035612-Heterocapsa_arctica.AAC.1
MSSSITNSPSPASAESAPCRVPGKDIRYEFPVDQGPSGNRIPHSRRTCNRCTRTGSAQTARGLERPANFPTTSGPSCCRCRS